MEPPQCLDLRALPGLYATATDQGRQEFASEVIRSKGDDGLQKLTETYKNHSLRLCTSNASSDGSYRL